MWYYQVAWKYDSKNSKHMPIPLVQYYDVLYIGLASVIADIGWQGNEWINSLHNIKTHNTLKHHHVIGIAHILSHNMA